MENVLPFRALAHAGAQVPSRELAGVMLLYIPQFLRATVMSGIESSAGVVRRAVIGAGDEIDHARRRWLKRLGGAATAVVLDARGSTMAGEAFTVYTFGDSILDCARYNEYGVHPGQLIVRNDDVLFPDFKGRDLSSSAPARLDHRARDGATVDDLARQGRMLEPSGPSVALVTIGGNDLLIGLAADRGSGMVRFERSLDTFLRALPVRPVLLGTVFDPTFGNDSRNFLSVDARIARPNLNRVNAIIGELAERHGQLVDVHRHFLGGDPSWFTRTIEPSLRGASEVRAAFLPAVLKSRDAQSGQHGSAPSPLRRPWWMWW